MSSTRFALLTAILILGWSLGACGVAVPSLSGLEGTWELVRAADGNTRFLITLDAEGNVTETATVSGGLTLTDPSATGTAELDGFDITVQSGIVRFEGAFNGSLSVAEGRQYTVIGQLSVDAGEATLTRVD